ncbi:MAG: hypothetical protein KDD04_02855 [Sinomicrobium sp.]|nr:hypothetical protein [Sinomicrobium sp.]
MENSVEETRKLLNRETLYELFKNGKRPTEDDFKDLIFSMINKLDDGIAKDFDHGLELAPQGTSGEKLLSFFHRVDDPDPAWTLGISSKEEGGGLNVENGETQESAVYISAEGNVGMGTKYPKAKLDVQGTLAVKTLNGNYAEGTVAADGQWHTLLTDLEGCNIFNVVACANGQQGEGKYALLHAIAVNAYDGKRGSFNKSQNWYGWYWWRRLQIRWIGNPFSYDLQIRTRSNYGKDAVIRYQIMELWKNRFPRRVPPPIARSKS